MILENIFLQPGLLGAFLAQGSQSWPGVRVGAEFPMGRGFLTPFSSFFSNALISFFSFLFFKSPRKLFSPLVFSRK